MEVSNPVYQIWSNSVSCRGRRQNYLLEDKIVRCEADLSLIDDLVYFYKKSAYGQPNKQWVEVSISVACLIPGQYVELGEQ